MAVQGLSYGTVEEYQFRADLYAKHDEIINKTNAENIESGASLRLGHNKFSTWTEEEFARLRGYKPSGQRAHGDTTEEFGDVPAAVDWTTNTNPAVVTPVKNQGSCGSCWTFGSTGAMEGSHALAKGSLISLSEQQLVDCAGIRYGNFGCNGGLQVNAFKYVQANGGITSESNYPYTGKGGTCNTSEASNIQTSISGWNCVTANNQTALTTALAAMPVTVAVDASGLAWQLYNGGILANANATSNGVGCKTSSLDHAVLAVGYSTTDGYYKIKNSWGTGWGE